MKYLYLIIIAFLTGLASFFYFRPVPVDPVISILRQQAVYDSIRVQRASERVDSLSKVIYQKDENIRLLKDKNALITKKYQEERNKLSLLSQDEAIDIFAIKTGGRLDSIYSIPRMNLLTALEIFITAEEETLLNGNLNEIIKTQDSTINLQRVQVMTLKDMNNTLLNSLELHKSAINEMTVENKSLNKKIRVWKIKQTAAVAIVGAGILYVLLR